MDESHKEILMLERQMKDIQDSASLFEVMVSEFKVLKQCRKELKMLKQLWDYVNIVRSCIEGWKTTPWRKIDVENMDIECKKFAKEIRGNWGMEDFKQGGLKLKRVEIISSGQGNEIVGHFRFVGGNCEEYADVLESRG